MGDESTEEIIMRLSKNFKEIIRNLDGRITELSKAVLELNTQDERLLKIIANYHDIDLDAIRKEGSEL